MKLGNGDEIEFLLEAAKMKQKVNTSEAIQLYNQVSEAYCNQNRISAAARLKKKVAEQYEEDLSYDLACKFYQEAYDLHEMEGDTNIGTDHHLPDHSPQPRCSKVAAESC